MVNLDIVDSKTKEKVLSIWRRMRESDKSHFVNQIALAMSIWGSDEKGRKLVVDVLQLMSNNGTSTLADFGLYIDRLLELQDSAGLSDKIQRASVILEGYRIKHALPSEPHRNIDL